MSAIRDLATFRLLLNAQPTDVVWALAGTANATTIADWVTLVQVATLDQNQGGAATRKVKAIVQLQQTEDAIVNAYGVNAVTFQMAAADLPVAPKKFDVVTTIGGDRYVLDHVVTHHDPAGRDLYFWCAAKGK